MKQPVGILKRLSVGVVLDDWQKVDADGKVTTSPMSEADIKRFSQLVRESIGLKEDRGDQLNVLNQTFKSNAPLAPVDGPPLWETPWVTQLAKQLLGAALVLVVAFLVLRPLMKSLTKSAPRRGAGAEGGDLEGDRVSISGQGGNAHQACPELRAADRSRAHPGRAGSPACRAGGKGMGLRRWLTSPTISRARSAPPSC